MKIINKIKKATATIFSAASQLPINNELHPAFPSPPRQKSETASKSYKVNAFTIKPRKLKIAIQLPLPKDLESSRNSHLHISDHPRNMVGKVDVHHTEKMKI